MAVAEYVTKEDLEDALKSIKAEMRAMEERLETLFKKYSREQADRVISAYQQGTSANF